MSGILQRKMAHDQDFAQQVKNAQATVPVVPFTPEGQQVESRFVARPFEAGRVPHVGQIVTYHHRKAAHIGGQLSHPAMIMGWSRDGLADLLVFTGAREGDWVQRWAQKRTEAEPWGAWEFCEPEEESPYKLMEIIMLLSRKLSGLEDRVALIEGAKTAELVKQAQSEGVAAPRPPGVKRH